MPSISALTDPGSFFGHAGTGAGAIVEGFTKFRDQRVAEDAALAAQFVGQKVDLLHRDFHLSLGLAETSLSLFMRIHQIGDGIFYPSRPFLQAGS